MKKVVQKELLQKEESKGRENNRRHKSSPPPSDTSGSKLSWRKLCGKISSQKGAKKPLSVKVCCVERRYVPGTFASSDPVTWNGKFRDGWWHSKGWGSFGRKKRVEWRKYFLLVFWRRRSNNFQISKLTVNYEKILDFSGPSKGTWIFLGITRFWLDTIQQFPTVSSITGARKDNL